MLGLMISTFLLVAGTAGNAGLQAAPGERAADPQDKVICKRFVETGSLVKGQRTCKTKREWERDRDNIRSGGPGINSCRDATNGGAGCN